MSLIRKHGAVLQAWACLDLVAIRVIGEGPNYRSLKIISIFNFARLSILNSKRYN